MARKDITDKQVCEAYSKRCYGDCAITILQKITGQPFKVCLRAAERALGRNYIEYGTNITGGWLTKKGKRILKDEKNC